MLGLRLEQVLARDEVVPRLADQLLLGCVQVVLGTFGAGRSRV